VFCLVLLFPQNATPQLPRAAGSSPGSEIDGLLFRGRVLAQIRIVRTVQKSPSI
jgi:hypothetical protein